MLDNNIKRDADQNNKMRTYRKFKTIDNYKCDDYLLPGQKLYSSPGLSTP